MADWTDVARKVVAATERPTLATAAADGTPRAVTVLGELNEGVFSWRSLPSRMHSKQIAENPQIAINFFDPASHQSVYGVGRLERTEQEADGYIRYYCGIQEIWVVTDRKVNGEFVPPRQLDPKKL